jgi:hypothetical protein
MPNAPATATPAVSLENLTQALASYEELAERRGAQLDDALADLEEAKNALEATRLERDAERDTRLWTARQIGVIERMARDACDVRRFSEIERQLKASLVLQAVIQLAEATRSQRAMSAVQESLQQEVES